MANLESEFTGYSVRKLEQFTSRIIDCLGRLNEEQVWSRGSDQENAVGNLALHLCGNVRQWIVAGVGGKPDTRQRDREFAAREMVPVAELQERLKSAVAVACGVIRGLSAPRLAETVTIQGYEVSVLEAVYHAVEHFAQHTGQIIFATKQLTHQDLGYYGHLAGKGRRGESTP